MLIRFRIPLVAALIPLLAALACPGAAHAVDEASAAPGESAAGSTPVTEAPAEAPQAEIQAATALRLFAAVEEAWGASDAERLAALVDTTSVRVSLKPGASPTAALTRGAAAFLFRDQLRLVRTSGFRVVRFEVARKGRTRAAALWHGDWGGRHGAREVKITLAAAPVGGRWLLTEVRADD